jgi:AcrR family transcriptional regulator
MNIQLPYTTEKQYAIFESTLKLIREQGFHGTPMSQIAQEAGVATGTIYHYFKSKDELILELFNYCKLKVQAAMFREEETDTPYPERFVLIWLNLANYYIRHPEVLSFLEQFFSSPYVKQLYTQASVCFQDEVSNFLHQGVSGGYIKPMDINIISAAYVGTAVATAKRHINGYFRFQDKDMRNMVGIIWDGIKI